MVCFESIAQLALLTFSGGFFLTGYVLAAWVGVGSFYFSNAQLNWRFPLSLQVLWPLLLLCSVSWLPESPRWRKSTNTRMALISRSKSQYSRKQEPQ